MKITFDYIPTKHGYRLDMDCSEMTVFENGAYDASEQQKAFEAIYNYIRINHIKPINNETMQES